MDEKPIWKSRKFGIMLADAFAGLLSLWVTYLVDDPELANNILITYGLIQPVVLALVWGIATEDKAALMTGTHPAQLKGDDVARHGVHVGSVQQLNIGNDD